MLYVTLGILAVQLAGRGGGQASQTGAIQTLRNAPAGTWLVAMLALGLLAHGVWQLVITCTGDPVEGTVRRAGRAGYAALGVVSIITGGFFVVAAVRHDPRQARGMSEALQTLADQPWGPWLLAAVAVGLILYGVFALAEARYRRVG